MNQSAPRLRQLSLSCHPQRVNTRVLLGIAAAALLCSLSSAAQDKGYWRSASTTASSITGDVEISKSKLIINFIDFPLVEARTLVTAEVAAAFDVDIHVGGTGTLYHLTVPAAQRLLHHNTLCGSEETQWMATFVSGHTMQVAFFSGATPPVFTFEAIRNSTDLCGTFTYAR